MSYSGAGAFFQRPGGLRTVGDLERRMRYLERRKQPTAGATPSGVGGQVWLAGGYRGAIFEEASLFAYYRLGASPNLLVDEVTTPSERDLTMHNGTVAGSAVDGPPQLADGNLAYQLNAAATVDGDYFQILSGGKFVAGALSDWSFECWICPASQVRLTNAAGAVNRGPIVWDRADGLGIRTGWTLTMEYGSPYGGTALAISLVPGGTDAAAIGPIAITGGGDPASADSWYHVVATHKNGGPTRLYVNGVLAGSTSVTGFDWLFTSTGFSGAYLGVGFPIDLSGTNRQRGFVGILDEVAIYSKPLSQSEILLHYHASGLDGDAGKWVSIGTTGGAIVGDGGIDTDQLADLAVTTPKIADLAVINAKLANGAVDGTKVANSLKPSGGAGAATEALRALGTTASTAMAGNDVRLVGKTTPTYSTSITPNAAAGAWQTITANNATAFTINAPSNAPGSAGTQELTIEISNASGGALGAITWNAIFVFTNGAFVAPANGKKRFVTFGWNGTAWVEQCRANADY